MSAQAKHISGHTHLISLLGTPIRHSASPVTHSVSFELTGIDAVYLAFEATPDDLPDILSAMRRMGGWDGSNVTMPNKQAVIPHLDGLSDAAALDGVKTVHIFARENGPSYKHAQTLIEPVKEQTGCDFILHPYEDKEAMKAAIEESNVLVNATPVGMGEGSTESAVPAELIKPGMVVADAVYFPLHTQLLQDAEAKGCTVVTGIGMMNEQAAIGEEIWYGIDMPLDKVSKELG